MKPGLQSTQSQRWFSNAGIYLTDTFESAGGHKSLLLTENIHQIFEYF